MNVIISSGEDYDIAFAQDYATNASKGAFADLTDLAPKYAKLHMNLSIHLILKEIRLMVNFMLFL